jgi:seryl-tRNA synthetase
MHDIKWIRQNPEAFDAALTARGAAPCAAELTELDEQRRANILLVEEGQARRNAASKLIGAAKASGDQARAQAQIELVSGLKGDLQKTEEQGRAIESRLRDSLAVLPNLAKDDVPVGPDEAANRLLREWGSKPEIENPKEHFDIGEALGDMDFETAAKLSGSRFVVLRGQLAALERALGQFMLDLHTSEHGYLEVRPPLLVRDNAVFGTGQLPKAAEDMFKTDSGHWLIPTAEVPLTNLVRDSLVEPASLPQRFVALTPCFRSEAGASGRDTRGMLRQHQFDKVEMVSITEPSQSAVEHERMLAAAEEVLKRLGLHYRVMVLSTGDMGFSARKTYDIEVWLPGQNAYREVSSCSVCDAFQARRMNARYRPTGAKATEFVHTLNGSGVAVGRALIAVLENYQNADGSVTVPEALRGYMRGTEKIGG